MDKKDPSKSMEKSMELTAVPDRGQDVFTNTHPIWAFAGGRGVYGGNTVAHCLVAAQHTVSNDFLACSIQLCFVYPGDSELPAEYYVERTRDGKSFAMRTVQARQKGVTIATATVSFASGRDDDHKTGQDKGFEHARKMPDDLVPPDQTMTNDMRHDWPLELRTAEILNRRSDDPADTMIRYWIRAKGPIHKQGGPQAHLAALAYISDAYLLGAIIQAHEAGDGVAFPGNLGMAASLTHTVYFHEPRALRADQWMCSERESPWAGNDRGLVIQRIWSKEGLLMATGIQEAVLRPKRGTGKVKL